MNDLLLPDYNQANQFLDALTGSTEEAITFQFFTDDKKLIPKSKNGKKEKDPRAKHRHMNRGAYAYLLKKQKDGCGVYVMVNAGDGKGRKGKNVVKVRALFVDLDGSPWRPAATALQPHLRVESSPGHWHLCTGWWMIATWTSSSPCNRRLPESSVATSHVLTVVESFECRGFIT